MSEITKINDTVNDNKQLVDLLLIIAKLVAAYGVPAAISLLRGLADTRITPERIAEAGLKKRPIEFFPCLEPENSDKP